MRSSSSSATTAAPRPPTTWSATTAPSTASRSSALGRSSPVSAPILSRFMLVEPLALAREAAALARIGVGDRCSACRRSRCVVVTPVSPPLRSHPGAVPWDSSPRQLRPRRRPGLARRPQPAPADAAPRRRCTARSSGAARPAAADPAGQARSGRAATSHGPGCAELLTELARPDLVDAWIAAARPIVASLKLDDGDLLRSVLGTDRSA
jgi:hypothetical protein